VRDTRGHKGRGWRIERPRVTVVRRVGGEGRQRKTNLACKTQYLNPKFDEGVAVGEGNVTSRSRYIWEKSHQTGTDRSLEAMDKVSEEAGSALMYLVFTSQC
jgi:hypothetical protein